MKAVSIPDPVSLQEHDDDAITAKLNEVYAAEDSALDPVLQAFRLVL